MTACASTATLLLSIDVDSASVPAEDKGQAARTFAALLDRLRIPAAWRLARPASAAEAPWMLGSRVQHEIGLLLQDCWAGVSASRSQFARELSWRMAAAKASGIELSTVAAPFTLPAHRLEALARSGLSLVSDGAATGQPARVSCLRYGLSKLDVSLALPRARGVFSSSSAAAFRRLIERAAKRQLVAHLLIDLSAIAGDAAQLADAEQLLARASELRDRGQLAIVTAGALSLPGRRTSVPAKSIMRAA